MSRRPTTDQFLLLKGTRTALSFVRESLSLAKEAPYPEAGQPGYSVMADVLSRAVLFADWEVVGTATLVRAGEEVWVTEAGLSGIFRTDEFMRRITWRLLADAAHDLGDVSTIRDAWRDTLSVDGFIHRRLATRRMDTRLRPTPIGRIEIPMTAALARRLADAERPADMQIPRAPRSASV